MENANFSSIMFPLKCKKPHYATYVNVAMAKTQNKLNCEEHFQDKVKFLWNLKIMAIKMLPRQCWRSALSHVGSVAYARVCVACTPPQTRPKRCSKADGFYHESTLPFCAASVVQWFVLSLSAVKAKGRRFKSTHGCSHTVQEALDLPQAIWLMHVKYIFTIYVPMVLWDLCVPGRGCFIHFRKACFQAEEKVSLLLHIELLFLQFFLTWGLTLT